MFVRAVFAAELVDNNVMGVGILMRDTLAERGREREEEEEDAEEDGARSGTAAAGAIDAAGEAEGAAPTAAAATVVPVAAAAAAATGSGAVMVDDLAREVRAENEVPFGVLGSTTLSASVAAALFVSFFLFVCTLLLLLAL